jgi:iron-sulfur cluster insertion protein
MNDTLSAAIEITEAAKNKIVDLLAEENDRDLMLRMFVQGGGCSGFQYGFTFDKEKAEDDTVMEFGMCRLVVDAISLQYLMGASLDYEESLMGASFKINNPNAQATCGCGSSFTV